MAQETSNEIQAPDQQASGLTAQEKRAVRRVLREYVHRVVRRWVIGLSLTFGAVGATFASWCAYRIKTLPDAIQKNVESVAERRVGLIEANEEKRFALIEANEQRRLALVEGNQSAVFQANLEAAKKIAEGRVEAVTQAATQTQNFMFDTQMKAAALLEQEKNIKDTLAPLKAGLDAIKQERVPKAVEFVGLTQKAMDDDKEAVEFIRHSLETQGRLTALEHRAHDVDYALDRLGQSGTGGTWNIFANYLKVATAGPEWKNSWHAYAQWNDDIAREAQARMRADSPSTRPATEATSH
ncbi:MAG TPA: hypothetical protein VG269_04930 [Tepidisphaeraceae bacterium]|nr:hypothetical protein [Tepidisphaeraceae bacterium]